MSNNFNDLTIMFDCRKLLNLQCILINYFNKNSNTLFFFGTKKRKLHPN